MKQAIDIKDRILTHLIEYEGKEISDPVLTGWLEENETNRKTFYQYQKIWKECAYYMPREEFDADLAWRKVNETNQKKIRRSSQLKNIVYICSGAAASLLILFVLTFMGRFDNQEEILMSMSTEYGNRSEVKLPDGSVIRLNSGSDITYTYDPKKKVREVQFQGEGFFDVAKSEEPFIIKMNNNLEISVLGTSFNLHAYADDPTIQTSLVEGSIEISHEEHKLLMKAGEMVEFDKETNEWVLTEPVLAHSYGWLENKLYMEDMSLSEISKHLERWYNVDINIQPGLGEKIHYMGVIQEETITDVLNALARLSDIKYSMKGKHISITSK